MSTRCYAFVNKYLSPIQQGIQAAHAIAELVMAHHDWPMVKQWVLEDKTLILLNGGDHLSLVELAHDFTHGENPISYPWTAFAESESALNNSWTCVTLIVPEVVIALNRPDSNHFRSSNGTYQVVILGDDDEERWLTATPADLYLAGVIKSKNLAR